MPNPQVNFRADEALLSALDGRAAPYSQGAWNAGRGAIAARDLERYYRLLGTELGNLTHGALALSRGEVMLLCDVANGTLFEAHTMHLLGLNVADAISGDGLDRKWGVDGPALLTKLELLTPGQDYALVDALERVWRAVGAGAADIEEECRRVGLLRAE